MELNQDTYSKENVVKQYDQLDFIFKGEQAIFSEYNAFLKDAAVLDIGIGAGRTTQYLTKLCKTYVGVDYSNAFVNHCKRKFVKTKNALFQFADARQMPQFADKSFDFIIFSFNGIDCVDFVGRTSIMNECRRLLANDGIFCFSFHNSSYIPKLFSLLLAKNPFKWPAMWNRYKMVNKLNPNKEAYLKKDYVILRDGADDFGTDVMYLKPAFQVQMLNEIGFTQQGFYDVAKGHNIPASDMADSKAQWIYCVNKKK